MSCCRNVTRDQKSFEDPQTDRYLIDISSPTTLKKISQNTLDKIVWYNLICGHLHGGIVGGGPDQPERDTYQLHTKQLEKIGFFFAWYARLTMWVWVKIKDLGDHRFKHVYVYVYMVSIDRPIIGVPNFDPYPSVPMFHLFISG